MAKIIFEFDYYEDSEIISMHQKCADYFGALLDIYNLVRGELKYGDEELSDHIDKLLEDIKEISGEFI